MSLVGRRVELSLLASALDTAAHGECSVVALSGDAGIGKSRLAEECVALARDREFVVLEGGASLYQQDLPYASIVEALRPVVRDDSQERARLVEGLSDLRRLFDELPVAAPSPVGDPGVERTRLFEAVCRLLERVSARQPLLLVLDDLQWADSSSLMLLLYLVRGLRRRGFVAVCVYRVNESGDQLRALMSSLRRLGLLVEVALGPLERNETAQLVHHLVGDHAPAALLDVIDSRAQGVPLFVTALVASLRKSGTLARQGGRWVLGPGGEEVPAAVKDLFLSRLAGLGAAARRVLEAVSVLGDAVDGDHVLAVLGHDDDFRACVDTLVDAGLLVEDLGSGRVMYRISHPLLAQIVYDQMSSFARQRMHANAEVVLSRRQPSDWIRRAHHVLRAGDDLSPRYAVEILAAATEAALVQRAGAEGVQFGQSAVALARRIGRAEIVPDLLEKVAVAAVYAGELGTAISAWREAASGTSRADVKADRLRQLALVEWDAGEFAEALAHADEAKAALGDVPVGPRHIGVLQARLFLQSRCAAYDDISADMEQFEQLARTASDPSVDMVIHIWRIDRSLWEGAYDRAEEAARPAVEYASVWEDAALARAYTAWGVIALASGFHREAQTRADAALRFAHSAGMPTLEVMPRVLSGYTRIYAGNWNEAETAADIALSLAYRTSMHRGIAAALLLHSLIHVYHGDLTQARACVSEADAVFGKGTRLDRHIFVIADLVEALTAVRKQNWPAALAAASRAEHGTSYLSGMPLRVLGDAQLGAGDVEAARRTAEKLATIGPRAPLSQASAVRLHGLVTAGTDSAAALEMLSRAATAFEVLQMPYDAALTWLDWATIAARSDRGSAAGAVERSLVVLDRLGARPDVDRARRLLRETGRRPTPPPHVRKPGELSDREAEVACLVAEGLSNADIAARLFISPRTVTTHLQNIYRRLDVESRTGLTRYVLEHLTRDNNRNT